MVSDIFHLQAKPCSSLKREDHYSSPDLAFEIWKDLTEPKLRNNVFTKRYKKMVPYERDRIYLQWLLKPVLEKTPDLFLLLKIDFNQVTGHLIKKLNSFNRSGTGRWGGGARRKSKVKQTMFINKHYHYEPSQRVIDNNVTTTKFRVNSSNYNKMDSHVTVRIRKIDHSLPLRGPFQKITNFAAPAVHTSKYLGHSGEMKLCTVC